MVVMVVVAGSNNKMEMEILFKFKYDLIQNKTFIENWLFWAMRMRIQQSRNNNNRQENNKGFKDSWHYYYYYYYWPYSKLFLWVFCFRMVQKRKFLFCVCVCVCLMVLSFIQNDFSIVVWKRMDELTIEYRINKQTHQQQQQKIQAKNHCAGRFG